MVGHQQEMIFQIERPEAQENGCKTGFFTPAEALGALRHDSIFQDYCRCWILERIHPAGPTCPNCGLPIEDDRRRHRFYAGHRITCPVCDKFFTATTGTFLAGTGFDFCGIFLLAALLAAGLDDDRAALVLACHPKTVRLWRQRFQALAALNFAAEGDDDGEAGKKAQP